MQHQTKCYCNSVASTCNVNCFRRKAKGSGNVFSVATSKDDKQFIKRSVTERNKTKTDFVKVNRRANVTHDDSKNRRGLGHSRLHSFANFSRRNSNATTVTFSTPCVTPASSQSSVATTPTLTTPSPRPNTILKGIPVTMSTLSDNFQALSVASKSESGSDFGGALQHEYTEQRRYYESAKQLMKLISAHNDNFPSLNIDSGNSGDGFRIGGASAVDAERLCKLQEFRLQNADDCFSIYRQLDLHLPVREKLLKQYANQREVQKSREPLAAYAREEAICDKRVKDASDKNSPKKQLNTTLTPYAVRQRLLRLRLEAEEMKRLKPGRKRYGALESSCALRYQETY
ncbi:unnamed protein product [Ceratitis capitata]|uniref:(Mediterranean fruit fly) hypothetical protein n=1 Tax=Ceratitis capitata TaxID=7213 RepID=A0A811UAH8_CERCA|nr:unnamed protein product [Ceratitis capitata]